MCRGFDTPCQPEPGRARASRKYGHAHNGSRASRPASLCAWRWLARWRGGREGTPAGLCGGTPRGRLCSGAGLVHPARLLRRCVACAAILTHPRAAVCCASTCPRPSLPTSHCVRATRIQVPATAERASTAMLAHSARPDRRGPRRRCLHETPTVPQHHHTPPRSGGDVKSARVAVLAAPYQGVPPAGHHIERVFQVRLD